MTRRQMTLKNICGYIMLENFIGRFLSWYYLTIAYSCIQHLRFCSVLCIFLLASLDRHAQLTRITRCFSALAELLVWLFRNMELAENATIRSLKLLGMTSSTQNEFFKLAKLDDHGDYMLDWLQSKYSRNSCCKSTFLTRASSEKI